MLEEVGKVKPFLPLNGTGVIGKPGRDDAAFEGRNFCSFLAPSVFCAEVWKQYDTMAFEGCTTLGVEVLQATGGKEEDVRKEDAGHDGGLFGLNDGDNLRIRTEQVKAK